MNYNKFWVEGEFFEKMKNIFDNSDIIKKELNNILNADLWLNFTLNDTGYTVRDNKLYENNEENKLQSTHDPKWRLFPIFFEGQKINEEFVPNTLKLFENVKLLRAISFSAFEPGYFQEKHTDKYNNTDCNYYRVHIPLITPKNNNDYKKNFLDECDIDGEFSVLKVENNEREEYRLWNDNCFFAFNHNLQHTGWNKTNEMRIILIVDIYYD